VDACTRDSGSLRLLVMIDEFSRECLAIRGSCATAEYIP